MAAAQRFRINRPSVIHEILDDELVVVNLKSGSYYSLDKVGAVAWREVESGASLGEVTSALLREFDGEGGVVERAAAELLQELEREELIVPAANGAATARSESAAAPVRRGAFSAPVLHKYTDMQDLLLLDPIHEVDEAGWPARKA